MRVLVTGSAGRVARALLPALGRSAVSFDLPDGDVLDEAALRSAVRGCDAVVHLAWDQVENVRTATSNPRNVAMAAAVLTAADGRRVVLASSVHASTVGAGAARWVRPTDTARPATPYGRSKVSIEDLGRATGNVVAIRLGGLSPQPDPHPDERGLWVSTRDCAAAFRAGLDAGQLDFELFYAISRNRWRVHSTANRVHWRPALLPRRG